MTPSLPTFSITSAMSWPISSSCADREATWATWFLPETVVAISPTWSRRATTAASTPRLMAMGLAPAAMLRKPSWMMACARTVAVVVPSPATSFVLLAASFRSCAPMFSYGSSSSISLTIVTPSLQTCGGPNFLSSTTLRPLGPRVTPTVSVMMSIPRFMAVRASSPNDNCFGIAASSWNVSLLLYFLNRMSSSRTTRYSTSPSRYSVPAYFE